MINNIAEIIAINIATIASNIVINIAGNIAENWFLCVFFLQICNFPWCTTRPLFQNLQTAPTHKLFS